MISNNDFTEIKGFKRTQYLPRLGKIRLGIKQISKKSGKEFPKEVDYFVCPPEVQKIYGEKPKMLDVMFASEDTKINIPFCYKKYGKNQRLNCKGNGETAIFFDIEKNEMAERACPCDALKEKACLQRGHLLVILPKVSLGGVYQIDTGSTANINKVLDAIQYWQTMAGRIKGIPLVLERVPEKMRDPVSQNMNTHYMFKFSSNMSIDILNKALETNRFLQVEYKVEAPKEDGKIDDTPTEIIDEEENHIQDSIPISTPAENLPPIKTDNNDARRPFCSVSEILKCEAGTKAGHLIGFVSRFHTGKIKNEKIVDYVVCDVDNNDIAIVVRMIGVPSLAEGELCEFHQISVMDDKGIKKIAAMSCNVHVEPLAKESEPFEDLKF